jgi:hypothetical protein
MVERNKELQKKATDPKSTAIKGTVSKTDIGTDSLRDAARKSVEKESK